jgi:transcriptional regulator with XRE-family HTH domain
MIAGYNHPMRQALPTVLAVVGRLIVDARTRARWSQRELARRSGISQSRISRIERWRSPNVSLATIDRLLIVLGVRYRLEADLPAVALRQRDFVHAWMMGSLRRRLARAGFAVEGEVEIGGDRSRGWIDVLAFRPEDRLLVVGEIKSDLVDIGDLERQVGWYEREAVAAARRRGWRPARVISAVFLLETEANDERVRANALPLRQAFPGRGALLQRVLAGEPPTERRYLVMIDPASRATSWVLPTRVDRRRSTAPYRDYADAARKASGRT